MRTEQACLRDRAVIGVFCYTFSRFHPQLNEKAHRPSVYLL